MSFTRSILYIRKQDWWCEILFRKRNTRPLDSARLG